MYPISCWSDHIICDEIHHSEDRYLCTIICFEFWGGYEPPRNFSQKVH